MSERKKFYRAVMIIGWGSILLFGGFVLWRLNRLEKTQQAHHQQILKQQKQLETELRNSGLMVLMNGILVQAQREIESNEDRKLEDATIERMASLSRAFDPTAYRYIEGDSLRDRPYIWERGLLLKSLIQLNPDSLSFAKILQKVSFSRADLGGADLSGLDLRGIKLSLARLEGANLAGTQLSHADLRAANLWGVKAQKADFYRANLKRANMSWAELDAANLSEAIMKGIELREAKLRQARLNCAILHYSQLTSALFNQASLEDADCFGSDLQKADFRAANLIDLDLRVSKLQGANLREASMWNSLLREVKVDTPDWLERLDEWGVRGAKNVQNRYRMISPKNKKDSWMLVLQ